MQNPIYREFEADLRLTCQTEIELTSYVPGNSAEWKVRSSKCAIDEAGLSWTIYADSAPPTSGVITFGSKSISKILFEQTDKCRLTEKFRQHFDPHKSLG